MDVGVKPSFSKRKYHGKVVRVLLCCTVPRQVLTEENNLSKKISGDKMDYHLFRNLSERHGRSGRSDTLIEGPIELFNIGYMLRLGYKIEGDAKISHFCPKWLKLTIRMYAGYIETKL